MISKTTNRQRHQHKTTVKKYPTIYIPRKPATYADITRELNKRGISYNIYQSYDEPDYCIETNICPRAVVEGYIWYGAYAMYNLHVHPKHSIENSLITNILVNGFISKNSPVLRTMKYNLHKGKYIKQYNIVKID